MSNASVKATDVFSWNWKILPIYHFSEDSNEYKISKLQNLKPPFCPESLDDENHYCANLCMTVDKKKIPFIKSERPFTIVSKNKVTTKCFEKYPVEMSKMKLVNL